MLEYNEDKDQDGIGWNRLDSSGGIRWWPGWWPKVR